MQVNKSFKFRIYPTKDQTLLLSKIFGCTRFVYNTALKTKRDAYKEDKTSIKFKELSKNLTQLKNTESYEWLQEVPATCLNQALRNLDQAYQNFFNSIKKKDFKAKYPQFKNKYSNKSARFQDVVFKNGELYLPKLGHMKVKWSQVLPEIPKMATVSLDSVGRYFVSFSVLTDIILYPVAGKSIGIDVGLKEFCYFSDDTKIENPRYLRNKLKALKRSQRALSRSQQESKRREQKRIKVAKLHAKVADTRKDFLHKISTDLVKNNDIIVVEDLKIKNMMKNRRLSRSIADASWGEFMRQLEYKSNWYGRTFLKISPNYTSRDCSCCGHRHETPMGLSIREWTCSSCGTTHDRDHNAAINILNRGMNEIIPGGTGKLTDMDIISSGQLIHGLIDETSMVEVSIHGIVACDVLQDVGITQ